MGNCGGNLNEAEREAKLKSASIDKQIKKDEKALSNTIKILLLGAGESGKSTLVKQMKIIHGDGFSIEEIEGYKVTIIENLISSMKAVINAMVIPLNLHFDNSNNKTNAERILQISESEISNLEINDNFYESMKSLWDDNGFKQCSRLSHLYQLNDSAGYFFANMQRILSPNFEPNHDDVLRARIKTTGIIETSFTVGKITYRMVDVGGQRSERRKWIQCFDDVKAVLFVASLSGYDMLLREDEKTNRLDEALTLFQAICNNKFFQKTEMILFLNKLDLFADKILNTDRHLRKYVSNYQGPDRDPKLAGEHIKLLFLDLNSNKNKAIYPHFTTATDTKNIEIVLQIVLNAIIQENLTRAHLI